MAIYKYACTGTGYSGGSGTACGGKYARCTCASGYYWNGSQCLAYAHITITRSLYSPNASYASVLPGTRFYDGFIVGSGDSPKYFAEISERNDSKTETFDVAPNQAAMMAYTAGNIGSSMGTDYCSVPRLDYTLSNGATSGITCSQSNLSPIQAFPTSQGGVGSTIVATIPGTYLLLGKSININIDYYEASGSICSNAKVSTACTISY